MFNVISCNLLITFRILDMVLKVDLRGLSLVCLARKPKNFDTSLASKGTETGVNVTV